jgi:hypothetical protein
MVPDSSSFEEALTCEQENLDYDKRTLEAWRKSL